MKGIRDFYNRTAREWADKWYQDETMLPYLKEFLSYLPKTPNVLDLCCGTGYESMRMKNLGAIVTGIDFSEESVQIARERNPDIKFIIEDMLNDYSYIGEFDGCAVIAGLVHLPNEKLEKAFDRIYKVLVKCGYLFIAVRHGTGKSDKSSYTTIDGENFDRDFYLHTIEELEHYSKDKFILIKEIVIDIETSWKYYIFQKA